MDYNWNLDILYKGFDDPKFESDKLEFIEIVKKLNELTSDFNQDEITYIENYLKYNEKLMVVLEELSNYCHYRLATNVFDSEADAKITELYMILQDNTFANVNIKKFLKNVDLDLLKEKSTLIKKYLFLLKNTQELSKHMLTDKEEILESKFQMVASFSWSDLQSKLCGNLLIKVEGIDDALPLPSVRNLAYDAKSDLRKNAYFAEIEAYKSIALPVAMGLNNIKREVNIMCELRGYDSALQKTLKESNMKEETLNALIEAIKEELPAFRKYFKLKAKALGHKNGLPFYDLFAPIGKLTKTYSVDEAKNLILDVYGSFSKPLYEMGKKAFENRWIDFFPKPGKEGGAFCSSVNNHKVCRVMTNFTGSLGDVQTLAHELGHAYHATVCFDNPILYRDYPMVLAETASIFCQTLMSKKLIDDMSDDLEKITVLENSLQEDSQCVVDILSRFLFESRVLSTPISVPLTEKDMCEFMLDAQDASYGDGLDQNFRHPYMWLCKSHYYSAGLSFYNYPYVFGLLYAKGLFKQYLKNKEEFVKKYDEMLKATADNSVEDVALKMGIDITKKEFWLESLKFIEEDIDMFEELLVKNKMI